MRETKQGKTVIFEERPWLLPGILFVAGLVLAAYAAGFVQGGDFTSGEIEWPPLLAAIAMMGGALVFLRRERFEFDTFRKRLRWSKSSVFRKTSGEVPFANISDVLIEETRDSDGSTYRLALRTTTGLLPFTAAYFGNDTYWEPIAIRMRTLLGLAQPQPDSLLRAFIADGRIIDAVKLVRAENGLGLAEAKAEVDRLRAEMSV